MPCAKSSNCISKEPVSSEIRRLPAPSTHNMYIIPTRFEVPGTIRERILYFDYRNWAAFYLGGASIGAHTAILVLCRVE